MVKGFFKDSSPLVQMVFLIGAITLSLFAFSTIATLIAIPLYGINLYDEGFNIAQDISLLRYFQTIQSITAFILPAIACAFLFSNKPVAFLGFKKNNASTIVSTIGIILIAQPLISYLGYINSHMDLPQTWQPLEDWLIATEKNATEITFKFMGSSITVASFLLNTLIIAILPAIGEELIFRGLLQPLLGRLLRNKHAAVWVAAFLFSALHLQFFGFLPRFFLGLLLGYLYMFGNNIWYAIVGHFTNNFLALALFRMFNKESIAAPMENSEVIEFNAYFLIGCLTVIILIFKKIYGRHKHDELRTT